ncbi:GTP cyclohydrolase I [Amycolatopsis sp. CA-230715]|uniref:GTP cyclohydrolase I n=1 Tax=Amycolatopsis sp. CA-230715 TaxID=2745196 RepID=UPI001C00B51D|nr:GTP cyclohydrolase I [Amycolatopsis sp. CA-230715]QWF78716.1 GTP cyclohydrolase 1 [Amycolatopsis sp. CA-230715]
MTTDLAAGIRSWLTHRGLDPDDPNLADTPERVVRAWAELTAGYDQDPAAVLERTFPVERSDGMIAVTGVPFTSCCAHHLMPFTGTATIAYLPVAGAPVVGLSKLPRLLDIFAHRLQVQEQLTYQVTDALDTYLKTEGSACLVRAEHGCMTQRGVRKPGAAMLTTSVTGRFATEPELRAHLMAVHQGG